MIWNTTEDNPYLEVDTILSSLNDSLTSGDTIEGKDEEEIVDSTVEQ